MFPTNVGDPGCLSRIPDPTTAPKEEWETFFLSYHVL
jgi:hypothetical protein